MEPDDAFLNALLSAPIPRRKKAKVRVPGQPPPSTDGELAAELRTSGASLDAVEIHQPSTGWTATVVLPAGEAVDIESVAVQRSKRSGTVYLRYLYEILADHPAGNSAPAREPEPEPPESARAAASRQARVKILTASRQVTISAESAGSEHGRQSDGDTPTAVANAQFFAAGAHALRASDGGDTEELQLWRRRFLRGISAATRAAVAATLARVGIGSATESVFGAPELVPLATRKKDLPSSDDEEGVRALLAAQDLQASLVERFRGSKRQRSRAVMCTALRTIDSATAMGALHTPAGLGARKVRGEAGEGVFVWEPARCSCEGQTLYANLYSFRPKFPRRRAVADALASASECRHVIGAAILAMAGLGGGSARPALVKNGETAVAVHDFGAVCDWVGASTAGIIAEICDRVRETIVREWDESRPLYLAGALLTRLQPPDAAGEHNDYDYSVAHVDKANVASYDYSSVLYLNSKMHSFQGGDFCFIDEGGDTVLEPRLGRCVIFSSGPEHLHQAQPVTDGSRFVLASWYTLSPEHGQAIPTAEELVRVHGTGAGEGQECTGDDEEELMDVQAMLDAKIAELQQDLEQMPATPSSD